MQRLIRCLLFLVFALFTIVIPMVHWRGEPQFRQNTGYAYTCWVMGAIDLVICIAFALRIESFRRVSWTMFVLMVALAGLGTWQVTVALLDRSLINLAERLFAAPNFGVFGVLVVVVMLAGTWASGGTWVLEIGRSPPAAPY